MLKSPGGKYPIRMRKKKQTGYLILMWVHVRVTSCWDNPNWNLMFVGNCIQVFRPDGGSQKISICVRAFVSLWQPHTSLLHHTVGCKSSGSLACCSSPSTFRLVPPALTHWPIEGGVSLHSAPRRGRAWFPSVCPAATSRVELLIFLSPRLKLQHRSLQQHLSEAEYLVLNIYV